MTMRLWWRVAVSPQDRKPTAMMGLAGTTTPTTAAMMAMPAVTTIGPATTVEQRTTRETMTETTAGMTRTETTTTGTMAGLTTTGTTGDHRPSGRSDHPPSDGGQVRSRPRLGSSVRARILLAYVGLLALATGASVLVAGELLIAQLDRRIDTELAQEANELRQLASGVDPRTSRPFGNRADRVFDVYLERNIPAPNEALLTFVNGEPYKRSRTVVDYRLDQDPVLVERLGRLQSSERSSYQTPVGRLEYLAVPLRTGGQTRGVFVAAVFRDLARKDLQAPLIAVGAVGLAVLLVGSILAGMVAESVLRPVRRATATAREITDTDWSRRVPVEGNDEGAELARTFNDMLDRLEAAFATQRRFLDDAGHELRTPITIMRGHLEVMGDDPQDREETIALVVDELSRMARIVHDLLLLARAEQPDFLQLASVDVAELTTEIHSKAAALGARDWVLEHVGRGLVIADRQRVTQAMVQLAQNAVQHTSDGDEIALGSFVEGGVARFWVRDTGPGISAEDQRRVFDRFVRAGGRRGDGAGLGLSIVRAIAEAHHGRVELVSRSGAGATFTLVVPVDQP